MNKENMMTISVIGLNTFAREITHEGVVHKVMAASVGDTFEEIDRLKSLLKDLVFNHLEDDVLNKIGISIEDLDNLGVGSDGGIETINIPPRDQWYD